MSDFRDIFKRLRKATTLTQDQLAAELGMSRSAISMYERGEREPDFETLETIADYFNVDMNYLTGWNDDQVNYEDPELIASIPSSFMEACAGDVKLAIMMMKNVDAGNQKTPNLTKEDERDIARDLETFMADLTNVDSLMFDGNPLTDEARESIMAAMKLGLQAAKLKSKSRLANKREE